MVGGGVHCPSIHFTDHNLSTAYEQLPCFCPFFDLHLRQHFQYLSIDNLPAQRLNRPIYFQPSSSCQVKPVGNRRTILTRVCGIFPLRSITCLLQIILHSSTTLFPCRLSSLNHRTNPHPSAPSSVPSPSYIAFLLLPQPDCLLRFSCIQPPLTPHSLEDFQPSVYLIR